MCCHSKTIVVPGNRNLDVMSDESMPQASQTGIETKVNAFVRNCWYVAAWVSEVPNDGLFHRTLLNESVLIYRTSSGGLTAMENRCCHRGAPLHLGRREDDCVRCGYHGMKFNETGACVEVPGQERIPAKAMIRTYPVVERDEFVWIWMGDPARADESKILSYWWHTDPGWRKKTATLHYNAPYTLIQDNLLDFSHLSYVHASTIGTPSNATTRANVESIEGGLKITRWYLNDQIQANRASIVTFTGPADRWQISRMARAVISASLHRLGPGGYGGAGGELRARDDAVQALFGADARDPRHDVLLLLSRRELQTRRSAGDRRGLRWGVQRVPRRQDHDRSPAGRAQAGRSAATDRHRPRRGDDQGPRPHRSDDRC
jgi:nitrite reductase/ring-hydroxylating ferredoxin subunit